MTALSALTRLWGLSWPHAVVFDEELYEQYIAHYFSGTYYVNLHPPVGKLVLALGAKILGIAPATLDFPHPAVALRLVPALAGTLIIPVFYVLLRQLGSGRRIAILGAFLLLLDNALLTVSRFILVDSLLILFMLGAISAWLASRSRSGASRWAFVVLSALLAGLAAGTKWTGLAALALVGLLWLADAVGRRGGARRVAGEALVLGVVPAAVYAGAFAIHFALLPNTGPGDREMSAAFRETLVGSLTYRADAHVSFAAKFVDLHRAMERGNDEFVGSRHPGASPWWSWPVLKHPLYIWKGDVGDDGKAGHVLIEGNPVLWWAILIALAALAAATGRSEGRRRLRAHRGALAFLLVAYLIDYLPFAFISRILFLYSYLPALIFSLGLAVIGVGALVGWSERDDADVWTFPSRRASALYFGCAGLALAAFVYFAPLAYGSPISDRATEQRLWLLQRHVFVS